jgi:MFS family permease
VSAGAGKLVGDMEPQTIHRSKRDVAAGLRRLALALPVALAFADASIVLLALPEIVARLHTSISTVVWVLVVYNLALIAGSLAMRFAPARLPVELLLIAGLVVFGAASFAAGTVSTITQLLIARGVQGIGGAMLLCASLPPMARAAAGGGASPLRTWSAAAATGAALGPAAGGLLTQLFDWRAIFIAQAPVAGVAAIVVAVLALTETRHPGFADPVPSDPRTAGTALAGSTVAAIRANLALLLLSAGLIGALFLSTLLLINVWGLTPIAAAAVLLMLPVMTGVTGRFTGGLHPRLAAAVGSLAVAGGLVILATATNKAIGLCLAALALSGAGLGVAFAALTEEALSTGPTMLARVANTIAARDLGLVIGLLVLTPIFVHQLGEVQHDAKPQVTHVIKSSGLSTPGQLALSISLQHAVDSAPASELPDIPRAFADVERFDLFGVLGGSTLDDLQPKVESVVRGAATRAFRAPLRGAAAFALLALIVVVIPLPRSGRGDRSGPPSER